MLPRRLLLLAALLPRPAAAAEFSVSIAVFAFTPATLTVPAGSRVTWTNRDDTPHTVTGAQHPPLVRTGALDSGDSFAMVFDTPGTYGYFCSLHPHMQGTVVVT